VNITNVRTYILVIAIALFLFGGRQHVGDFIKLSIIMDSTINDLTQSKLYSIQFEPGPTYCS
jgi:hypothetical protein